MHGFRARPPRQGAQPPAGHGCQSGESHCKAFYARFRVWSATSGLPVAKHACQTTLRHAVPRCATLCQTVLIAGKENLKRSPRVLQPGRLLERRDRVVQVLALLDVEGLAPDLRSVAIGMADVVWDDTCYSWLHPPALHVQVWRPPRGRHTETGKAAPTRDCKAS